ncbi:MULTISPECIES: methyltransferase family protein [Aminobacterium]|uniref:methyltransferase family protein n=1 Tax=Aminobacterium TaxID=81466 RepID=UPI00257EE726|nr:isoprenylcysteine carboxylmethyltransferase family protein [Aminobacterium sp. UBA4834]
MTHNSFRAKVFHLRGGLWTGLYLLILLGARPVWGRVLPSLLLVAIGQLLRFWAVGCIQKYRGEQVKADQLVTWGPYALVRNPLYVGNGLIGLGWAVLAGPWVVALFLFSFALIYGIWIVPHEESFLRDKFGERYNEYCQETGCFFPVAWPKDRLRGPYNWATVWKSERHSLWVTIAGTVVLLSRFRW